MKDLLGKRASETEKSSPEPPLTLQDKIRAEASVFDFTALLDGVKPKEEPEAEATPATGAMIADPEPNFEPIPRQETQSLIYRRAPRQLKPALFAILMVAAVALPIYLLNSGVLQSAGGVTSGPVQPLKPDISQTARKGLPFPPLTPGERLPTPRLDGPISKAAKQKVFANYGIGPGDALSYVVIRLIPVELGGTDNPPNLFPTTPWFADLKSRLEKRLVELVKTGQLSVEQAELELKDNWVRATHRYYIRNYGIEDPDKARQKENELKWE
jgi:hypothetical protein